MSPEEIFGEMHKVGLYELEQVKWAILETDGRIALIPAAGSEVTGASAFQERIN